MFDFANPRERLIRCIVDQTWGEMNENGHAVVDRLKEHATVIVDESLPETLVWDDKHGEYQVYLKDISSAFANEALATIKLQHRNISDSAIMKDVKNQEINLFNALLNEKIISALGNR